MLHQKEIVMCMVCIGDMLYVCTVWYRGGGRFQCESPVQQLRTAGAPSSPSWTGLSKKGFVAWREPKKAVLDFLRHTLLIKIYSFREQNLIE